MMSLALPWVFGLGVLGALGIAALHLLSVREPPPRSLPTARFVPGGEARAVARQPRPSDRRLLALRVLALLSLGAAFSGMRCSAVRSSTATLVFVAPLVAGDSLQWLPALNTDSLAAGAAVVRTLPGLADDPGIALVHALRDATAMANREGAIKEIGLVVVVPPMVRTMRGWNAWRSQWPAQVRVLVHGAPPSASAPLVRVIGPIGDDPVRAAYAVSIGGGDTLSGGVLDLVEIRRDPAAIAGAMNSRASRVSASGVAPSDDGRSAMRTVVEWPSFGVPTSWKRRVPEDTVYAITARGAAIVGPFVRRAEFEGSASARDTVTPWHPIAWWSDGAVAAIERRDHGQCWRAVGIEIPSSTDLLLSASARGLLTAIGASCGHGLSAHQLTDSARMTAIDSSAGAPRMLPRFADAELFRQGMRPDVSSNPRWLGPLLLVVALLALAIEYWWRIRVRMRGDTP